MSRVTLQRQRMRKRDRASEGERQTEMGERRERERMGERETYPKLHGHIYMHVHTSELSLHIVTTQGTLETMAFGREETNKKQSVIDVC